MQQTLINYNILFVSCFLIITGGANSCLQPKKKNEFFFVKAEENLMTTFNIKNLVSLYEAMVIDYCTF